jgi:hypothetical protein
MPTESEIKLARYQKVETETDAMGRAIGVRRLKPSEQTKVAGYCADLTGYDEVVAPDGTKVQIPHRMPLLIAAAVCKINEDPIPFPRNRAELDSIYDRLDQEGLAAAGAAVARLSESDLLVSPAEAAKN